MAASRVEVGGIGPARIESTPKHRPAPINPIANNGPQEQHGHVRKAPVMREPTDTESNDFLNAAVSDRF